MVNRGNTLSKQTTHSSQTTVPTSNLTRIGSPNGRIELHTKTQNPEELPVPIDAGHAATKGSLSPKRRICTYRPDDIVRPVPADGEDHVASPLQVVDEVFGRRLALRASTRK